MATRRKRSRSGRSGARAGGPPTSNALEWAERLARGEEAPQPTALEWAESLATAQTTDSAGPSGPWAAPREATKSPGSPFGRTGADHGRGHTDTSAASGPPEATGAADVPTPFGASASGAPDGSATSDSAPDDAGTPGWESVASERPARRSRRGRVGKVAEAPGSQPAPADTGTDPSAEESARPLRSRRSARAEEEPAGRTARRSRSGRPGPKGDVVPAGDAPGKRSGGPGSRPRGRTAPSAPTRPSRARIRRILATGLPKAADRPTVLIVAAVVAVVLGLGAGWATNYFGSGKNLAAATPQQCAAAQTAWTKAANAQTGISESEPASVRSGFIEARDAMASVDDVPAGIAEDWEAAHAFYTTVADALEAEKAGDAEGIAEAAQIASTKVDTDDMIATSKRITRYVNADCNA